ncbi:SpoIIE family protein phosphatase [Lachnospiraceae bacterium ZAX-1]
MKRKLLKTMLGVTMGFALVIVLISVLQMEHQKANVDKTNTEVSEKLGAEIKTRLEETNLQVARDFSAVYAERINQNFKNIRENVETIANAVGVLHQNGSLTEAGSQDDGSTGAEVDDNVGLMQGATRQSVKAEFSAIKGIRQLINTLPTYDPKNLDALDIYITTQSGMCLDGTDGSGFVGIAEGEYADLRETEWYQRSKEQPYYWASIFTGAASGKEKITCAVPVYGEDGRFIGVTAGDITKAYIGETVLNIKNSQIDYIILYNENNELMINVNDYPDIENLQVSNDVVTKGENLISFIELPENGWKLCLIFQEKAIQEVTQYAAESIAGNGEVVSKILSDTIRNSILLFVVIVVLCALLVFFVVTVMAGNIVKPLKKLTEEVKSIGAGNLDQIIEIDSKDEIGELADDFNEMTQKLKAHIENAKNMASDKERIMAQFNIMRQIQKNMLPLAFSDSNDRKEFEVCAKIVMSNEGGGNFYDFFFVDKQHLCIVSGDTSGSGLPTTLMAVVAKTHIKNYAGMGYSPTRILAEANNQLSYKNDAGLQVKVFLGILDLTSGQFDHVNAGQPDPLWKHSGAAFVPLATKQCFALASMENIPYLSQSVRLVQGDILLLYTQGVPETIDARGNLYMESNLNEFINGLVGKVYPLQDMIEEIEANLDQFAGGAQQLNDRTIVALRYFG